MEVTDERTPCHTVLTGDLCRIFSPASDPSLHLPRHRPPRPLRAGSRVCDGQSRTRGVVRTPPCPDLELREPKDGDRGGHRRAPPPRQRGHRSSSRPRVLDKQTRTSLGVVAGARLARGKRGQPDRHTLPTTPQPVTLYPPRHHNHLRLKPVVFVHKEPPSGLGTYRCHPERAGTLDVAE